MKMRIASVNNLTFLQCYKHKLWGANHVYVSNWEVGDLIVFKTNNNIVAVAEVSELSYYDNSKIWDNGLFWNRVPLKFLKVLNPVDYIDFVTYFRPMFINNWGKQYGWVILNKAPISEEICKAILDKFNELNDASEYYENIDSLISIEKNEI